MHILCYVKCTFILNINVWKQGEKKRLIDWMNDWSIEWMIDRLNEWLIDWTNDWSIEWMIDRLNAWLVDWMNDWSIEWMIDRLNEWIIDWLFGWLIDWLIDCLVSEHILQSQTAASLPAPGLSTPHLPHTAFLQSTHIRFFCLHRNTGWPVKHGRDFLVHCEKWLVQCKRVQ